MKLCWCEGFCMPGEGLFWGSIAMAHLTPGPSFLPPPSDCPVFSCNIFRSHWFPLQSLKCHLLERRHLCCRGHLQIQASSLNTLEGGWVVFEPNTNRYWSSRLIWFVGNRVWSVKVRLLPDTALILNSQGTNSSLTNTHIILTAPPDSCECPYQQQSLILRIAAKSSYFQII